MGRPRKVKDPGCCRRGSKIVVKLRPLYVNIGHFEGQHFGLRALYMPEMPKVKDRL